MIFAFLLYFLFLANTVLSKYFICPNRLITLEDGPIGVIPRGRVGLSVIPANYNCTYYFYIPPGFALHFSISTHYEILLGDQIVFTNNLGEEFIIPTPNQHIDEWSASSTASLLIRTISNSSQMFAIYEFVNIHKYYRQKVLETGDYFALNSMKFLYYTFKSHERIKINIAIKSTQDFDPHLEKIFVYDGGDLKNSKMIGNLYKFSRKSGVSTKNNISFINLYDVPSPSYVIGNDYSIISKFAKYKAVLMSKNEQTSGEFYDSSNLSSAYTWICSDCSTFYWNVLKFDKWKTPKEEAFIEVQPLSPSHQMKPILNYSGIHHSDNYFPQLLPTRMFTVINHHSKIGLTINTLNMTNSKWLQPYDGRKGIIHSPSLWDPQTRPSFNYSFEDPDQTYYFNISVKSVNGETLILQSGPEVFQEL
ncbi:unnamed protein product [Caenorhabditis angaria]|uniref:CUB-like domain-containing protein n=1 Tax=Caenorhabditis angaria TaxID=860376 RepID=A0A9P1N4V1_9PELO|nr:unnamed protein product [Caenorhabditis angaria]